MLYLQISFWALKWQNPNFILTDSFTASKMWLCYNNHGSVLVYRVHAPGCHGPPACHPLPHVGHHEGWRGTVLSVLCCHSRKVSVKNTLIRGLEIIGYCNRCLCGLVSGQHWVFERLQHAVHWGTLGGHRGGKLEPSQTHRSRNSAADRCPSVSVRECLKLF